MRASIVIVAMLACGRISFEPTSRGGSNAGGDGGSGGSGSNGSNGSSGACAYQACPTNQSACCVGNATTCMDPTTCTGQLIECDPVTNAGCTSPQVHCCQFTGMAATTCTLPNVNCN